MPEAVRARTTHIGQFRLVRLQVVNWGTFCGYKDLRIDERGVLLTGPSGSGKSSLLDALSTALLPANDQRFNASADLTARGAKQSTRSVADYVRGAWSQTSDENDQSQVQYLRGGKPTWSAVAATFDDGLGSVTTAVAVRWFPGVDNDSAAMNPMYQLHDGDFDLSVMQGWAERGFDTRWLKATYPVQYPPSQGSYLRDLAKRIGLGQSRVGLSLLGKAKALKNVGDLNLFVRMNMLDEPETFAQSQRVVNSFTPLNEAYETASRAHAQARILRDVPDNWTTFREAGRTSSRAEDLLGTPMEHYLRGINLRVIEAELDRLDKGIEQLDVLLQGQNSEKTTRYKLFQALDATWSREGQSLRLLEADQQLADAEARSRREAFDRYSSYVARLDRPCPHDERSFTALRDALPDIAAAALAEKADMEPRRTELYGAAATAISDYNEKNAELTALRSARTLIPSREADRRLRVADGAKVPAADLSYAAELIDIAPGEERWRPAAERVLRSFGLRLLVPDKHKDAVRRYIDENDMRGIVEYSIVTAASAHRPKPAANTLAGKLVVDAGHPSASWLAGQLAQRFDHVCVETARDLESHPIAVTLRGTVKMRGNHYRKDDRAELTSPSSYILGANPTAKRAAVEREVAHLAQIRDRAVGDARAVDERYRNLDGIIEATQQIVGWQQWTTLDHWTAAQHAKDLEQRIADIKASNVDLQRLETERNDAEDEYNKASDVCSKTRIKIEAAGEQQTALIKKFDDLDGRPHTISDPDDIAYLDEILAGLDEQPGVGNMRHIESATRSELQRRRDNANSERKLALDRVRTAIGRFIEQWPDVAPDTSGDAERSGEAFVALHDEIAHRRLPDAMEKFQHMINQDMVPSIGLLQHAIQTASKEIEQRIRTVNVGLRRVEFNSGTHLQIAVRDSQPREVKEFRAAVDTLLRHAPAALSDPQASVAQFRRVRDLMARFTADTAEARRWKTNVLDVRESYIFYGREEDVDGATIFTYQNTAANSGGEQEKLVAFCLAAALSYNLSDSDSDGRPRFAPLMLDEAFSKSDETFAAQALAVFDEFGFQLLMAAPIRMSGIVEPFIGQAILVEKRMTADGAHSNAASATFGELAVRRDAELDGALRAAA
ncbi:MAG TPA: SbcC/MukB-like Walker B domain-containing protein [Kribbellaceae bacterium]|nr:SbcC/MukB-like Walker B domain-containing protein [Kribbellaceae bacterium]